MVCRFTVPVLLFWVTPAESIDVLFETPLVPIAGGGGLVKEGGLDNGGGAGMVLIFYQACR